MSTLAPLVTLSDVKAHLNLPLSDTSQDVELQGFIDAATEVVTDAVGAVTPQVFTETYDTSLAGASGSAVIMLRQVPVLTVTSVVEYLGPSSWVLTSQPPGQTVNAYGYSLDVPGAGKLVRRGAAGTPQPWLGSTLVVTYTAGRASIPARVRMAVLEDLRGLYQITQQGGRPAFGGEASESWSVGPLQLFPRLDALLASSLRVPGIA